MSNNKPLSTHPTHIYRPYNDYLKSDNKAEMHKSLLDMGESFLTYLVGMMFGISAGCFITGAARSPAGLTAGLAVIGVIGSGIGIGTIFASFIQAVGRNPASQGAVFPMTMLVFALVEAIALFALVIALVILFG